MDSLQSWLVVGIPGLVMVGGLFVGSSKVRAWIGYVVLAALVLFFLFVPGDAISAAAIGSLVVVFVATGRGTHLDDTRVHEHQDRERLTTTPSREQA